MCVDTAGRLFEDAVSTGDITFCATNVLLQPRDMEREILSKMNGKFDHVRTTIYKYQCITVMMSDYWLSLM
jgi:hypothetical protein